MARLVAQLPDGHWLERRVAQRLLAALAPFSRESDWVLQASVLALGQIGDADLDPLDESIRSTLAAVRERFEDQQARRFALIALAQASGRRGKPGPEGYAALEARKSPREYLLDRLGRAPQAERCWAALALGVLEHAVAQGGGPASSEARATVRAALRDSRASDEAGALAVALGLMRDVGATELLLERLETTSDPEARGYVALALGLVGETSAVEPIQEVLARSRYAPELLRQAAIALGLLGDRKAVPALVDMLAKAQGLSSQAALASALGTIGDARSVEPLLELFRDPQKTARARGFAAAALGLVGDKELLPWRSALSVDLDYRANTETLSSPGLGTGILDIL
jgi:HEAT repeat protein